MIDNDMQRQFIENKLSEPHEYSDRYVAFLDMLGFSDMCGNKKMDCFEIKAVYNDIELLKLKYDIFAGVVISDEIRNGTDFTFMSDSIIISAPHSDPGLLFILYLCSFIQNMLLQQGILLRGGIADGEFFKLDSIMFGPALISAYTIESKTAIYPRIVLSGRIIDELKIKGLFKKKTVEDYIARSQRETEKGEYIESVDDVYTQIETLIKQSSEDAYYFVNHFNLMEMLILSQNQAKKEKVNLIIKNGLSQKSDRIKQKYQWLENYYNSSLESYKKVFHFSLEGLINA
ncbi:MAG: hypothetical protein IKH12_09815 [Clostridia bacterium]|nr:hypothetical protein [Clostridia bacterium]